MLREILRVKLIRVNIFKSGLRKSGCKVESERKSWILSVGKWTFRFYKIEKFVCALSALQMDLLLCSLSGKLILRYKVKVSHNRPRWPKGCRVG